MAEYLVVQDNELRATYEIEGKRNGSALAVKNAVLDSLVEVGAKVTVYAITGVLEYRSEATVEVVPVYHEAPMEDVDDE